MFNPNPQPTPRGVCSRSPTPSRAASQLGGLQDPDWVKEDETMKSFAAHPSPALGFDDFSAWRETFAPLAGQIAADSCCRQRTRLKRAYASAALEFAANLHRSVSCELLGW